MKLEELQRQARIILGLTNTRDLPERFQHVQFTTRSGGAPDNKVGVREVYRESTRKPPVTGAYSGSVIVAARHTGALDAHGREIYVTPDNVTFVYQYQRGSPESFDHGCLTSPTLLTGEYDTEPSANPSTNKS